MVDLGDETQTRLLVTSCVGVDRQMKEVHDHRLNFGLITEADMNVRLGFPFGLDKVTDVTRRFSWFGCLEVVVTGVSALFTDILYMVGLYKRKFFQVEDPLFLFIYVLEKNTVYMSH